MKNSKFMKKAGITLLAGAMMFGMTACKDKEEGIPRRDINLDDYVKLGEYKGVSVDKAVPQVYTDEMFNEEMRQVLEYYGMYELKKDDSHKDVKEGDTVSIDYVGTMDDVAFDGGTGSYNLTIGSHSFIDGFEDGLIGHEIGEEVVLDLHFPDPYPNNPDLSGKPVTFTVNIKELMIKEYAEFNDQTIQSITGGQYTSASEFKNNYITTTNEDYIQQAENSNERAVVEKVIENAEFLEKPEDLWQEYYDVYYKSYQDIATAQSLDLATFLTNNYGLDEAAFEDKCTEYADTQTNFYLVFMKIAELENLTVTEEEYTEYVNAQLESYGITEEEFFKDLTPTDIYENMIGDKAVDFIVENASYNVPTTEAAE